MVVNWLVKGRENASGEGRESGEDVTGTRSISSTSKSATERSTGLKTIDIVGSNEVLSKTNNSHVHGGFTVMISSVL
jgi:hypothetical protein